jgi:hypothetical protein
MSHATASRGVFVLSLDLPMPAARTLSASAHDAATRLIRQVRSHHVAATWSVSHGVNLAQVADLLNHGGSQNNNATGEIAWRGEAAWTNGAIGRGKFAIALAERTSAAHEAGVQISTLLLSDGSNVTHLDVAAKYGIRALSGSGSNSNRQPTGPQAMRFGVWQIPVTATISAAGSWWMNQARRAIHAINVASRSGSLCHVHADLSRPEAAAVLDRVLAHVQRLRVEGRIAVETIGQAAARLSRPRVAIRPARSILRAA